MSFKKSYVYYSRFSVQEGLDTETNELQMKLGHFDKDIFKKYSHCSQVFFIKKQFKMDEDTCNTCVKPLEKDTRINPKIHVLWKDNAKYRVLSDLYCSYVDNIFRREKITEKIGQGSNDDLEKHLNVLLNY